jgi:hypothetical protein
MTVANSKRTTRQLHDKIIDLLLESPLNIPFVPDDLERELYICIFQTLDTVILGNSKHTVICNSVFDNEDLVENLKETIVDTILNSKDLNIRTIPDEFEQQLYYIILDIVIFVNKQTWFHKLWSCKCF